MQRLSRESLRIKTPQLPEAQSPIIYDTSKQAKKAYSKRKGPPISAAERRRIERLRVLDERAEKIRQKEERKKQNAQKRKLKEDKEGPKKFAKITSSQPELSKFFVAKKEHTVAYKVGGEDLLEAKSLNDHEDEDGDEEDAVEEENVAVDSKPLTTAESAIESETDDHKENLSILNDEATTETHNGHNGRNQETAKENGLEPLEVESGFNDDSARKSQGVQSITSEPSTDKQSQYAYPMTRPKQEQIQPPGLRSSQAPASSLKNLANSDTNEIPQSSPPAMAFQVQGNQLASNSDKDTIQLSDWDDTILTPQTLARLDQVEKDAEAAITKREEDDRVLNTLREETDYNDFDDDYDLVDELNFEYADGATSPMQQDNDSDEREEVRFTSSQAAYGIGLSDPAFDELQEGLGARCGDETALAEEAEQKFNSSFLYQAFEDDLRELEEDF
ncbi:hypothetical protein H072_4199 [Dactylellina haptotyla CBS 200.50]|uniref:Uncharacterized protein n=1 Tax=Dactylellina haptotyla (strain CBS 200.50) TaxID=1284197 RepID=S8AL91_DACHA|nr:hypothetical protein H072_4199 [Dactylellina haptotyla CBS 200.50]